MTELKSLLNIKLENDLGKKYEDEEIIKNLFHCFQVELSIDRLGIEIKKSQE